MITLERTTGKAYTPDAEYAAFSGRVTQTFNTTYCDPKEKVWIKRTIEYIDIGRADAIKPFDTVDAMEPIVLNYEPNTDAACKANARRDHERWAMLQMDVTAYLRQNGPSHMTMMANDLEQAKTTLDEFIRKREGTIFCRVGRVGKTVLWGLVGVHDKEAA